MKKELVLQKLVFIDENQLNPSCETCGKELGGYLISQEDLIEFFSPIDIGYLAQKHLIQRSQNYEPQLIIFLCKSCLKGERK